VLDVQSGRFHLIDLIRSSQGSADSVMGGTREPPSANVIADIRGKDILTELTSETVKHIIAILPNYEHDISNLNEAPITTIPALIQPLEQVLSSRHQSHEYMDTGDFGFLGSDKAKTQRHADQRNGAMECDYNSPETRRTNSRQVHGTMYNCPASD